MLALASPVQVEESARSSPPGLSSDKDVGSDHSPQLSPRQDSPILSTQQRQAILSTIAELSQILARVTESMQNLHQPGQRHMPEENLEEFLALSDHEARLQEAIKAQIDTLAALDDNPQDIPRDPLIITNAYKALGDSFGILNDIKATIERGESIDLNVTLDLLGHLTKEIKTIQLPPPPPEFKATVDGIYKQRDELLKKVEQLTAQLFEPQDTMQDTRNYRERLRPNDEREEPRPPARRGNRPL
jgi:hypothetical protein